ncbi:hypothetical protein LCL95_00360 [Bacillus timonensis]|nr:hypothetical protein [Bacillus timonensis]
MVKQLKRLFIPNLTIIIILALLPVYLVTHDISVIEHLIDTMNKSN